MIKRARLISISNSKSPTLLDWSAVEGEIGSRISQLTDRGRAFVEYAVSSLFGDAKHWISDGGNDRGVDAVVIDDLDRKIHILNCKCVRSHEKSRHNFPSGEIDKVLTFLNELIEKCPSLENCNPILADAVKTVWSRLEIGGYEIYLHLCSNQMPLTEVERNRISLALYPKRIKLQEHSLHDFASGFLQPLNSKTHRLNFIPGNKIERLDASVRTITGYISLFELRRFLSDEEGGMNSALFHSNVRAFLGARTSVNTDIASTLNSDDRSFFECLNNGLKIVCDSLVTSVGSFPVNLVNPQIVNGLQTANVCFLFAGENEDAARNISVFIQIAETKDKDRSTKIALASNNQQRIGTRDFRANDELQIKLEQQLRRRGFTYVRKQGEVKHSHSAQAIDALRLGQIVTAYHLQLPDKAKTQTQAIFDDLYNSVFDPAFLSADRVIGLHALYRLIEEKKQFAKVLQRKISNSDYTEEWIIEGIFHVLYAIRLLMDVNRWSIFEFDRAKKLVDEAVDIVGACFAQSESSAYRYFRLAATRTLIEEAVFNRKIALNVLMGQMELKLI